MGGEPAKSMAGRAERNLSLFTQAPNLFLLLFVIVGAGNNPASKITITLAFTSVTAGNRF